MLSRLAPKQLVPSTSSVARTVAAPTTRRTFSARVSTQPTAQLGSARLPRAARRVPVVAKPFSSTSRALQAEVVEDGEEAFDLSTVERVSDEVDVCIVGGGPAGLSAAIRIMQKAEKEGKEVRVVVLEKGAEIGTFPYWSDDSPPTSSAGRSTVTDPYLIPSILLRPFAGAHILSGAVIETRSLDELIPDWKELGAPIHQLATSDSMRWLTPTASFPMPHPPHMSNKGNYIISLSKLTRWLAEQAEALGVEIYPGFAGAQVLYSDDGTAVRGVVTNEIGLDKNRQPKDSFEPGMEFHAKVTLFAEGAHGSLSKQVINKFNLREGKDVQTYGLGVKEVWKVKPENHKPGHVQHTLGWPLDNSTYGGTWLYHMEDEMVSLGIVVGLDYQNPYMSPFKELQRIKHHPLFKQVLEGGECIAYGARALNEGGFQSVPKLTVPGGALIGCSAGFLNVPKIKGELIPALPSCTFRLD